MKYRYCPNERVCACRFPRTQDARHNAEPASAVPGSMPATARCCCRCVLIRCIYLRCIALLSGFSCRDVPAFRSAVKSTLRAVERLPNRPSAKPPTQIPQSDWGFTGSQQCYLFILYNVRIFKGNICMVLCMIVPVREIRSLSRDSRSALRCVLLAARSCIKATVAIPQLTRTWRGQR